MKKLYYIFPFFVAFFLSACAYQVKVPQGNVLYQRNIDQLKIGMNKMQVEYLFGSPLMNALEPNTFNYVDIKQVGSHQEEHLLIVHFNSAGKVSSFTLSGSLNKPGFKVINPTQALQTISKP